MAWRNAMSNGLCCCSCCCCCNQRQLLAVILIFTIAMGAPHSDPTSLQTNFLAPISPQGYFATRNNTKVTAQRGGTALLPCTVQTQSPALVSWVRRRDFQLLTVGLSTYSSDERFLVQHIRHMGHWALRIKAVRDEDQGLYECQLSVHPVQSVFIELKVVEAVADIMGAPDLHIDEGSTLRLECKLNQATEYPAYVFWYHQQSMVNFDQQNGFSVTPFQPPASTGTSSATDTTEQHHAPFHEPDIENHLHHHGHHQHQLHHHHLHLAHRYQQGSHTLDQDDGRFGINALEMMVPPGQLDHSSAAAAEAHLTTDTANPISSLDHHPVQQELWALNHSGFLPYSHILSPVTSILTIKEVHSKHAGNYTCAPSNTRSASITVHVLQGEKPAAMQHANQSQLDSDVSKAKGGTSSRAIHPDIFIVAVSLMLLWTMAPESILASRALNR
ncbi:uncharacterized protein LOC129727869 [Wyeomyia smithii]|uniref:uncharacterized protein LOC129727869 n=1 Tax=Wyeomyia smithii TaxID=174621 RepID=UPI002467DA17|nr:uncharacterized protein LOC129727869 [Wyeomyia smithii]XP_055542089.1 uncharacterized protein LOC129727869 [Wyeomyia smithii]XP_055542090.1 uncharacterized protein LOC129727869 [Wyeomyia smithii]